MQQQPTAEPLERLPEAPRRFAGCLALFRAAFTVGDAAAVCLPESPADEETARAYLAELQRHGLLLARADEPARFHLPEEARRAAEQVLAGSREAGEAEQRHARHFLQLAEELAPGLASPERERCLARLAAADADLQAALEWAGRENPGRQLRTAAFLAPYWLARDALAEGSRWLEKALAGTGGRRSPVRLKAVLAAGIFARYRGESGLARAHLEEAATLFRERGDTDSAAQALSEGARLALAEGDLGRARGLLAEALALLPAEANPAARAHSLMTAAMIALAAGDMALAAEQFAAATAAGAGLPLAPAEERELEWVVERVQGAAKP